jgi:uncharacterized protein (TIGR00255 family)
MYGMTAYSFKENYYDNVYISTEIKTVNNRFLDINISMPFYLNDMEMRIRELIQKKLARGKVDVTVYLKLNENTRNVSVDLDLAGQYVESLQQLIDHYKIADSVKLFHLTRYDGIIQTENKRDYDKYWKHIQESLSVNLEDVLEVRKREGTATRKNLLDLIKSIEKNAKIIEKKVPKMEKEIFENLRVKMTELIGNQVDEVRLLNECATQVSRSCINEEVERLKTHTIHFNELLDAESDVGKKLDFICQEMHRETNTIGSKISLVELTENVITIKHNIEKIRELLRNIE